MAPLACLLRDLGHDVRGSDGPLYPPTSELLADAGIEPLVGYDPAHLSPRPDLVIVGNAVPRTNPQAMATEELGLPSGFALGGGPRFAIEGDEYNASYFDRGPKFWHYRPETVILTSLEHDHVDLYPDFEGLERAFLGLVERLPSSGLLIACADYPAVERVARASPCRVVTYGGAGGAGVGEVRIVGPVESGENGISFELDEAGERQRIELGVWGEHNAANATAVWIAARADGLDPEAVLEALATFRGVKRRLEVVGSAAGVVVIDDFAHHASEVAASLSALRQRFPGRRLVALFEPRSLSAGRRQFAADLAAALASADRVFLAPVFHRERLAEEGFDPERLAADIERLGAEATACESNDVLADKALAEARAGDVLVTMSSGSFDGMPRRLVDGLAR